MKLAARDRLIEQHIVWARRIAAKVAGSLPTWFTVDDLIGPAELALVETAAEYDPSRGIPFRAYAIRRIEGACLDSARRNEYRERAHGELTEEIQVIAETEPETPFSRAPYLPNLKPGLVWEYAWRLPIEQFRVIYLVYDHDLTVEQAAERMSISPSRASQHHTAALRKLKEMIG